VIPDITLTAGYSKAGEAAQNAVADVSVPALEIG
jgi:hypothetical protein